MIGERKEGRVTSETSNGHLLLNLGIFHMSWGKRDIIFRYEGPLGADVNLQDGAAPPSPRPSDLRHTFGRQGLY